MHAPRRIVSLISSATEMVALLGRSEALVGISHECDFPPQVNGKARLTRSLVDAAAPSAAIDSQVRAMAESQAALYEIDVERLTELAPELILTQAQCDVCAVRYADVLAAVETMPAALRPRVVALNPQSLHDVFDDIVRVGEAIGAGDRAASVLAELGQRVERVRQRLGRADRRPAAARGLPGVDRPADAGRQLDAAVDRLCGWLLPVDRFRAA